jgi:hypothetical protein
MTKKLSLILIFGLTFITVNAKVRSIDIKRTLDSAKVIQMVTIFEYTDSLMYYGYVGSSDTLSINCKVRMSTESFRLDLIKKGVMKETNLAGKWPEGGDTTLIVINKTGHVELFANLENDRYRFWDPNSMPFVNSVFWIRKERPFVQLEECQSELNTIGGDDSDYWTCTDGCYAIRYDIDRKMKK